MPKSEWARRDSNPHAQGQQGLSPLCLPVSPRALFEMPGRAESMYRIGGAPYAPRSSRARSRFTGGSWAAGRALVAWRRGDCRGAASRTLLLAGILAPAMGGRTAAARHVAQPEPSYPAGPSPSLGGGPWLRHGRLRDAVA